MKITTIEQANRATQEALFFYIDYIKKMSDEIGQRELCRRLGHSESFIAVRLRRGEFSSLKRLANEISAAEAKDWPG